MSGNNLHGVQSLLSCESDWRNIQTILRSTLLAIQQVLVLHQSTLDSMAKKVERFHECTIKLQDGNENEYISKHEIQKLLQKIKDEDTKARMSMKDELEGRMNNNLEVIKRRISHLVTPIEVSVRDMEDNLTNKV